MPAAMNPFVWQRIKVTDSSSSSDDSSSDDSSSSEDTKTTTVDKQLVIYVGDEATDGGQDNASASCGERGADRGGNIYFSDDRGAYEIFRKK